MRLLPLLLLALTLLLAACGGDSEEDARALLRQTFSEAKPVESGKVRLDLAVDGNGIAQLQDGLRLGLSGPFESRGKGKTPRFDLDLSLGTGGATLKAGAVSTGEEGWLKLQGQAYALSKETFDQLLKSSRSTSGTGGLTLKGLGVEPETWLDEPEVVGREDVDGTPADHVRGTVDVPTLLEDASTLLQRAGSLGVAGAPSTPAKLSAEQRETLEKSITSAVVDVWTGAEDRRLRRLRVDVRFDVPEDVRGEGKPEQKGTVRLDLRFSDLDQRQDIGEPEGARPFSELQEGLAALGAAMAQEQQGGDTDLGTSTPEVTPPQPAEPAPSGGGTYADCLARAAGDLRAQQACADLLGS
jgi:hypothetical protein